jgi:diguanylate cyclase (GGDEF)-like protein/PAS domain S-box-containing protein
LIHDQKHNISLLNPSFVQHFGYTNSDLPSLTDFWLKAFPDPDYRNGVQKSWQNGLSVAQQSGQTFQSLDMDIRCKNGELKHIQMVVSPLVGSDELLTLMDLTPQYQANQALTNTNLLLQTILETLPIRVFWKDRQSRYLGANHLFAEDAGLNSVTELIAKNDYQLSWSPQAGLYQRDDQQVMNSGQSRVGYEEPQTNPKGEIIWLRTSKLPLRNSEQEVIGVLGVYEDITARKRLDEQLVMRTTFLEALLDCSPDGILVVGKEGKKLLQNRRLAELWGIPPEIANQPDDARQLAFVRSRLRNPEPFMQKVVELYENTEQTSQDEIELIDGMILDRYSSPVRDTQGNYYGRIWHFADVTEMRQTQKALQQKEFYQSALLDNFPFIVWLKDTESRYMAINQVFSDQIKVDINDVIGKTDFDIFPHDLAEKYRLDDQQVMNSGLKKNVEETIGRGGEQVWVETYKAPLKDEQNRMLGTVGFARDISERKQAEETLKLAALVFENSSEAMLVTDADNIILNVNAAFMRMTGYSREEVIGKDPKILGSGEQSPAFYQAMWQSINATGSWHGEIRNKRKSGEIYIEEIVINTIFDNFGRPQRRVALFSDITHRKQTEEQIWQQANFDPLTGLPNRSLLRERMGVEIKKAQRTKRRFAVLFIDLDRFKEVNDTLGHEIGDELLQQAAQRLLACVRSTDTVARLGGDEFTVILEDLDTVESPERVVKQLVEQLSLPFTLQHEQVYVSASIGVTLYPDDAQTLTQLLKNADQAMYAAKNSGRNCYSFFTPSMQANLIARAAMMHDLRSALGKQEFKLVYQPIVELTSGKVYKAEALIRWQHPERGLVSPAVFVPLAEDSGLINDIGDWVFHTAAQQVAMWRQSLHPEFQISINKSPIQFLDVNHQPADWILHLHNTGLPGQAIVVEITEGLLLEASEKTAEHLLVFRDAGVQVAIDDFGTGYSALSYLNKFDIDYLKIDQSFVRNLNAESSDFVLCEAIIVMAHKLGLKVIAEGVETDMQRDLLASINCDFGQGYLFARPMSAEDFTERYAPDQKND